MCRSTGHLRKNCPINGQICKRCNKIGHTEDKCNLALATAIKVNEDEMDEKEVESESEEEYRNRKESEYEKNWIKKE